MTQDMLRGLNQLINKVAAAVPANMRAPQHTVHDVLTQQAQTLLHQHLSSKHTTQNTTNAENLALSVPHTKEGQTSTQQPIVSIPLTDDQVKLIKNLLAQQVNAQSPPQSTSNVNSVD